MGQELVGTIILSDGPAEFKPKHLLPGYSGAQPLPLLRGNPGLIPCACSLNQIPCVYNW